jgi:hypothetical protein
MLGEAGRPEIAAILERVPSGPATSFREALQSVHFLTFCLEGLYQLGRPDRYLIDFYRRDVERGLITPEAALELIDCICILFTTYTQALVRFSEQLIESLLGEDWVLGPSGSVAAYAFEVLAPRALSAEERRRVRAIVDYNHFYKQIFGSFLVSYVLRPGSLFYFGFDSNYDRTAFRRYDRKNYSVEFLVLPAPFNLRVW